MTEEAFGTLAREEAAKHACEVADVSGYAPSVVTLKASGARGDNYITVILNAGDDPREEIARAAAKLRKTVDTPADVALVGIGGACPEHPAQSVRGFDPVRRHVWCGGDLRPHRLPGPAAVWTGNEYETLS